MPNYVDGFVVPVPKKKLPAYIRMAKKASKIWKEYGALDYKECVGDDLIPKFGLPFAKGLKLKRGETVCFSYVVFRSRAHRDQVNAKVMKAMSSIKMPKKMPFDPKRMMYGGF